ncbi:hypothetical protein SAOR_09435 [Salinisphaera orenii MK-B5]|uniref:DnaJ homologue subfamily C member 28 conserved domain-containing protein n=2 Tax=Salinisphaera orenii TaxID=856731 RepID=A0A423PN69_9GAMM|nr:MULTISPECIES: DnaJ family domain-containing protein [Salinisphaera]ROO27029.1 hypothetical protein SAOR_09435 [Salinisphaera orenii MK-B5]ROO35187.1 hypothetical protein SAHL_02745 [Salinisphaera halophila YIM 95161]
MSLLDRLADAHIEAAAERGEFDDLPGAGQPLNLDDDRHVPPELRAGYRLLKNAGFVPPEIESRRAIRDIEELLAATEPESAESERLTRRLRWLETRLRQSRRGRALLADPDYAAAVRDRFAGNDDRA